MGVPSKTQVDKAGSVLRKLHSSGTTIPSAAEVDAARALLREYRRGFQLPLTKANMGLRSCARTATRFDPGSSQRLKQPPRIIDKLLRKPTMRLSQMEDIGGCRCVVPDLATVHKIAGRVRRTNRVIQEEDLNLADRATGYRALHLIVDYDDHRIEVQLRTERQHSWAEHVESLDDRLGSDLKDGNGPEELQIYLKTLSDAYASLDQGRMIEDDLIHKYTMVRDTAENYLSEWRRRR